MGRDVSPKGKDDRNKRHMSTKAGKDESGVLVAKLLLARRTNVSSITRGNHVSYRQIMFWLLKPGQVANILGFVHYMVSFICFSGF